MDAVRRIMRVLRLAAQRTQHATGISAAQLFVLRQLGAAAGTDHAGGHLSLSQLAELTLTDRSSVADVVERLESRRLVRRTSDPRDRRRAAVSITAAGRALLRSAPEPPTSLLIAALQRLPAAQLANLSRGLHRLTDALHARKGPAALLFSER